MQKEFLKLKCNSVAKDVFKILPGNGLWAKYVHVFRYIGNIAMRILLPFSAHYMCESHFSALASVKTRARNKLDCEADIQCATFIN